MKKKKEKKIPKGNYNSLLTLAIVLMQAENICNTSVDVQKYRFDQTIVNQAKITTHTKKTKKKKQKGCKGKEEITFVGLC